MSTIHLEEPLTAGGIQAINFFNGRLLSGEDLTHEQAMNLLGQRRLGQTIGTGVAFGLEVEKNASSEHRQQPCPDDQTRPRSQSGRPDTLGAKRC